MASALQKAFRLATSRDEVVRLYDTSITKLGGKLPTTSAKYKKRASRVGVYRDAALSRIGATAASASTSASSTTGSSGATPAGTPLANGYAQAAAGAPAPGGGGASFGLIAFIVGGGLLAWWFFRGR